MEIIRKLFKAISNTIKVTFVFFIKSYQYCISPLIGPRCIFYPTCSNYALNAIKSHGCLVGLWLILKRLLKCHPLHAGGYDPVPPTKKVNKK